MCKKLLVFVYLFVTSTGAYAESESPLFENPFLGFGVWFGGDKVAINPGGDNYNAGSGAILELGAEYHISEDYSLFNRSSVAYRYQGAKIGKGKSSGVVIESSIMKEWNDFGIGAGLHVDIMNEVDDEFGTTTRFEDSIGSVLIGEWRMNTGLSFLAKYLIVEHESKSGVKYSGDQYGVFMVAKLPAI